MSPRPISAPEGTSDRETCCMRYSACLDLAIREGWPGFSCARCPLRGTCNVAPEPPLGASAAQMAIDAAISIVDFTPAERKRMSTQPGRRGEAYRNYGSVLAKAARRRHGR